MIRHVIGSVTHVTCRVHSSLCPPPPLRHLMMQSFLNELQDETFDPVRVNPSIPLPSVDFVSMSPSLSFTSHARESSNTTSKSSHSNSSSYAPIPPDYSILASATAQELFQHRNMAYISSMFKINALETELNASRYMILIYYAYNYYIL